jgi:hypothetical protein
MLFRLVGCFGETTDNIYKSYVFLSIYPRYTVGAFWGVGGINKAPGAGLKSGTNEGGLSFLFEFIDGAKRNRPA